MERWSLVVKFPSMRIEVAVVYDRRALGGDRGGPVASRLDTEVAWRRREKSLSSADRHRDTSIERSTARVTSSVAAARQGVL